MAPAEPQPLAAPGEALARVSRMRTLSALLDDALDDDAELPAEALALFAPPAAGAAEDAEDAEMASLLEQTRRNEFACVECHAHAAEVFCEQCHDYFCELCLGGQHRKGNRRKHTFQPLVSSSHGPGPGSDAAATEAAAGKDAVDYEVGSEIGALRLQCTDEAPRRATSWTTQTTTATTTTVLLLAAAARGLGTRARPRPRRSLPLHRAVTFVT